MKSNQFWTAMSKALTTVTVMLIVTLVLTTGAAGEYKILYQFKNAKYGASPTGNLILDAAGNLYGATRYGGTGDYGTVFMLKPNPAGNWTETVLYSFKGADGAHPYDAGLVIDATGNLYGTTLNGGSQSRINAGGVYGCGVVFKLAPNPDGTWTDTTLYSFTGMDGAHPAARLVFDAAGSLYGTTRQGGGADDAGALFQLKPSPEGSWTESTLHRFTAGTDGADPVAGLIFDAAGRLFGTTQEGADKYGLVFTLTPASSAWTETALHTFTGYGAFPAAGVIMDAAGTLYGTVSSGSANHGFVFEIIKNCIDHTFVMPVNGTLYLQQKGGEAGASTEFGIGTSPTNFVKYYSGLPNNPDPVGEVLVGTFTKGTIINFGMFTQFGSQSGWAFTSGSTRASVVAYSDVDNSLHMGGKVLQQLSPTTWLLHLDDALSYLYDDDDNDVLMQIRIVPQ